MKKVAFTIIYLGYFLLGITGFMKYSSYAYTEQDSWHKVINDHLWVLIFSAVVTGALLFYLYIKWVPDQYNKRKDKFGFNIYMPLVYCSLAFVVNTGILFQEDIFFSSNGDLLIRGVIMNKMIQRGSKGGNTYFLSISDTITKQNYYFKVKKQVYLQHNREDIFVKNFHISKLGIIYRKEE